MPTGLPAGRRRYGRWVRVRARVRAGISLRIFRVWDVVWDFFFGIGDRRRNYITAARPLAQIDQAAALAAEREVRIGRLYRLFADGAAEFGGALAWHKGPAETELASFVETRQAASLQETLNDFRH